ncbi:MULTISPECIES: XRE family transcriptional regulator [Cellulophaga]|uniref:Helix-turn-helix domain protein n=2 Tax=Cellulophaga TaxID=104264 RepID=F0RB26_CELLC|nr:MULTISPECIES: LexA family transcriptional regulator [Cellulophaga]ADY30603.1 helix-turn-helix domain protein [Cellulophaga lytica DSM 7489]AIM61591.1 DNA-binding protein [Cellulophaga lytica]APU11483.1 DNA-binding protein [Cellulophaga lytica]EWH14842.1 helix-turn-helix domain-containing protein [Cellulophaga geojensis KL-A]MDO6853147.1 LexA family transcriptional regulator [Cellulophaga lytica]
MGNDYSIEVKRFTEVRRDLGFTQAEFAKLLGISSTTADIERGRTKLSGKVVTELLKQFKINPLWLFGEGNQKYLSATANSVIPKFVTVDAEDNENMVLVNAKAAAGYPQNIQDASWYKQLPAFDLPIPEFRNATYRGFQVEGDSMLPNLYPGEWVLAKATESLNDISANKMYVVVLYDAVLVKKIEKVPNSNFVSLISLNETYPPYQVAADQIQELWQVNSKISFGLDTTTEKGLLKELQQSMEELKKRIK